MFQPNLCAKIRLIKKSLRKCLVRNLHSQIGTGQYLDTPDLELLKLWGIVIPHTIF